MSFGEEDKDDDYPGSIEPGKSGKTPMLESHSRDLTELAKREILDPIIGRDEEIERVSQILSRMKKK